MRSCPTCSTKLALADAECPTCADDSLPMNDALPDDGLAAACEIVISSTHRQVNSTYNPPLSSLYTAASDSMSQAPPRVRQQPLPSPVGVLAVPNDAPQRIAVRKGPRPVAVEQIASKPASDAAYGQIKERVRQRQQSRKARRIVAAVCTLTALVLICAGAAIVSHARTATSAARDRADNSRGQNGADFSQLVSGGLGS